METAHHLLATCRYSRRIWSQVATWTGQPNLHPNEWPQSPSPLDWWENISTSPTTSRKGTHSLALLISWENLEGEERQDFQSPQIPDPDHHGENQERGINLDRCRGEGLSSPFSARIDLCFLVLSG